MLVKSYLTTTYFIITCLLVLFYPGPGVIEIDRDPEILLVSLDPNIVI
jgi:hypothetical protein